MADPTEDQGQSANDQSGKGLREQLEAANERARLAEERWAAAEPKLQQLEFHEAGLGTLTEKQRKAVLANLEGEVTVDAIKATAAELNFGGGSNGSTSAPTPPTPTPPANDAGLARHEQFVAAGQSQEPSDGGEAEFRKEIDSFEGSSEEFKEFLMTRGARYLAP